MGPQTLTADRAGERADAFLARTVPDLTRSAAQKLLEEGRVTAGGKPLAKNTRLTGAETVSVLLPEPELPVLPAVLPPVPVLLQPSLPSSLPQIR